MGLRGMSIGSILIILVIVLLLFGTRRLRSVGEDLGAALKGFRKATNEQEKVEKEKKDKEDN